MVTLYMAFVTSKADKLTLEGPRPSVLLPDTSSQKCPLSSHQGLVQRAQTKYKEQGNGRPCDQVCLERGAI